MNGSNIGCDRGMLKLERSATLGRNLTFGKNFRMAGLSASSPKRAWLESAALTVHKALGNLSQNLLACEFFMVHGRNGEDQIQRAWHPRPRCSSGSPDSAKDKPSTTLRRISEA